MAWEYTHRFTGAAIMVLALANFALGNGYSNNYMSDAFKSIDLIIPACFLGLYTFLVLVGMFTVHNSYFTKRSPVYDYNDKVALRNGDTDL
jgi:heme A synthase